MTVSAEVMQKLVAPFFAQGETRLYLSACCRFLYAGIKRPDTCGTCKKPVTCIEVESLEVALHCGLVENSP